MEVRDMQANYPDMWNLYLLGLNQLYTTSQEDPFSYYGLASIHGKPYQTSLDAPGLSHKIGTSGYCPHSMALFLGWHRLYLALFEQELHAHMQRLAESAPADQVDRYRWAANSFRMPYWDWAEGNQSSNVPDFFMTPTVVVPTPKGRNLEIWNPLYKYDFKPVPSAGAFDGKWSQINHTIRWPASNSPWEESRNSQFAASFAKMRRSFQDQTAIAFRRGTLNGFWEAVEMVHGWVHAMIGGGYSSGYGGEGHMWPLEYSSYEPLFWLHHTNVDRLFALYQAQNPDAYLQPSNVSYSGNVFVEDNTIVDGDTPLLPFRRNPGSFWTTNEAMDWRLFGYDYPETQSANATSAKATVAQLYSGSVRGRYAVGKTGGNGAHLTSDTGEATYTDWIVNTAAAPLDLPPTFIVQFSLVGDFSSDLVSDVGMWSILMPMEHNKAKRSLRAAKKITKRATQADMTLHGAVSLTSSLLDQIEAGKLQSLEVQDVVPFLREKLTWKVYSGNGTQLPDSSLKAISIGVASEIARIPSDPNAPIEWSNDAVAHSEVTAGKLGGAS
ncbi:tyrosinase [Lizonia empirigonia]|nr:tyrosinase [Lizonia empirigonia]